MISWILLTFHVWVGDNKANLSQVELTWAWQQVLLQTSILFQARVKSLLRIVAEQNDTRPSLSSLSSFTTNVSVDDERYMSMTFNKRGKCCFDRENLSVSKLNKCDESPIERAAFWCYIYVSRCDQPVYRSVPLSRHAQKVTLHVVVLYWYW